MSDYSESFSLPDYPSRVFRQCAGWQRLLELGKHVFFPPNHILVHPGDTIDYCYVVVQGRVISMEYTPDGSEHIFNLFEEGSIFLESNLLIDTPAAVHFRTAAPTELVRIDRASMRKAMAADFELVEFVMASMSYKYYSAMDQLRENYSHDAMWKVYNLLLIFAANFGRPRGTWTMIDLKLSQQMLSNFLGINRVTIGKVISELKQMELVQIVNGYYCVPAAAPENP